MKALNEYIKSVIGVLVVLLSYTYFFYVTIKGNDSDPQIIIAIVAVLTLVTNNYFQQSADSAKKDETISSLAKSIPDQKKDEVH